MMARPKGIGQRTESVNCERLSIPKTLITGIQDAINMGFEPADLMARIEPLVDCIFFDSQMDRCRRQCDMVNRAEACRRQL